MYIIVLCICIVVYQNYLSSASAALSPGDPTERCHFKRSCDARRQFLVLSSCVSDAEKLSTVDREICFMHKEF